MKRLLAFFAMLAAASVVTAAEETPAIETLFKLPQYRSMQISPDAEHLAALVPGNGRQNIVVINLKTRAAVPVTGLTERDVVTVRWINSKRLLYSSGTLGTRDEASGGGGLYAIDRDGADFRMVGDGGDERMARGAHLLVRLLQFVRTLPDESDDFIAQEWVVDGRDAKPGALVRVDSRTGKRPPISFASPNRPRTKRGSRTAREWPACSSLHLRAGRESTTARRRMRRGSSSTTSPSSPAITGCRSRSGKTTGRST